MGSIKCQRADPNSGIFLPSAVSVYISTNGKKYELSGTQKNGKGAVRGEPYLESFQVNIKKKKACYIRIVAKTIEPFVKDIFSWEVHPDCLWTRS